MLPESPVTRWFAAKYGTPTPAQAAAWPRVAAGRNVLVVSPTGTGKTFAAFLAVLNDLALAHARGELADAIHCLYLSPLRALSYDLEKNLNGPLREIYGAEPPIRVGLRTGDTTANERAKQAAKPPHLLLTTPESLCILLSQEKWLGVLRHVRWVIVDEVHALAENKRGAHLSLSLERLDHLRATAGQEPSAVSHRPSAIQRIGLSATVAPLDGISRFLVGAERECEIVDVSADKRLELDVYTPLQREPYPAAGFTGVRLMRELAALVQAYRTTLVFTNTRSGAETATFKLKEALPDLADRIECHHASLDRDVRQDVEDRLKRGELRAVVCSTSLELGIDIGSVDLVVMLASPKGVARALQRAGRAGHSLHTVSRGLLMATNMNDLVECCATARLARRRHLDTLRLPAEPLDVLAQHLVSLGCTARWTRAGALTLVRRAWLYRGLSEASFNDVLDYLAGGGKSLRRQYTEVFGKIVLDDEGFETRPGSVRRDFLQNAGTIPNEGVVRVRLKFQALGSVEESFARNLRPGDVFMIAGRAVRVERHGFMELFVARADHAAPTVPRWNANKMPLSNRVAAEIRAFRGEIRARFTAGDPRDAAHVRWLAERLECGLNNAAIIVRMYRAQHELSEIPTADAVLVEELLTTGEDEAAATEGARPRPARPQRGRAAPRGLNAAGELRSTARASGPARHYFFHCLVGRAANDALSRVVALRLNRLHGGNAVATPDDYGFVLTVGRAQAVTEDELGMLLAPEGFAAELHSSLNRSELLKYHFRNAAQTGLMIYRNFFGEQKPARKLHWSAEVIFNVLTEHEPDHVLLREARRDAVNTFLDVAGAEAFLRAASGLPKRLRRVPVVPPLSFAMYATKIREALMVEDPQETLERLYHHWWEKCTGPGRPGPAAVPEQMELPG